MVILGSASRQWDISWVHVIRAEKGMRITVNVLGACDSSESINDVEPRLGVDQDWCARKNILAVMTFSTEIIRVMSSVVSSWAVAHCLDTTVSSSQFVTLMARPSAYVQWCCI